MNDLRYDQETERTQYNLRTVKMPDLRNPDCRTSDDKLRAELVRIVDALQALTFRLELLDARLDTLERGDVPFAMAGAEWGRE